MLSIEVPDEFVGPNCRIVINPSVAAMQHVKQRIFKPNLRKCLAPDAGQSEHNIRQSIATMQCTRQMTQKSVTAQNQSQHKIFQATQGATMKRVRQTTDFQAKTA